MPKKQYTREELGKIADDFVKKYGPIGEAIEKKKAKKKIKEEIKNRGITNKNQADQLKALLEDEF